jgi:K+-sensing histidine kinase KdpD
MHVLETKVIDTGLGISDEIKKTLFIPLKELRNKEDFADVTNKTIGLGLSFSKQINTQLKGDIKLLTNKKNLTVFGFRLPVKYRRE